MSFIIVGLGNPGQEYANTRHNAGRILLDAIRKKYGDDFKYDKKTNSLISNGKIGKEKVVFMAPETFMNNSGKAVCVIIKNIKAAKKLIVIYDDFNLPMGKIRISYNRSSGGHNGLESIIKAVKTEEFIRVRVGTSPENSKGLAKVPHGEDKIEKFILGKFSTEEMKKIKKISINVTDAVLLIIKESKERAMSVFNGV